MVEETAVEGVTVVEAAAIEATKVEVTKAEGVTVVEVAVAEVSLATVKARRPSMMVVTPEATDRDAARLRIVARTTTVIKTTAGVIVMSET